MNKKPLYIPVDSRKFGLKVYCFAKGCSTLVFDKCKLSGLPLQLCKDGKHRFKVIAYDPVSGGRKTKNLAGIEDLKTALIQAALFQQQVKESAKEVKQPVNNSSQPPENILPLNERTIEPDSLKKAGPLLVDEMRNYLHFLSGGENVPEHKRRKRSKAHCRTVKNHLLEFIKSNKDYCNVKKVTIDQVNDEMVGRFHKDINSQHLSSRSYNMKMQSLRTFFNYLNRENKTTINPFVGVIPKPETHEFNVLTGEEFYTLLDIIRPELGKRKVGIEEKNYWREWLVPVIKCLAYSGKRSEEILRSNWNDIETDPNGNMILTVTDFKVSRQQNRLDNPKRIKVPITSEFQQVLENDLGYSANKGSDRYIIGPDEQLSRENMKILLGRAFSHFWQQTEFSKTKKATIKILRKTFITALSAEVGIHNAALISHNHTDTKLLQHHYASSQVIGATAKNFSVFNKNKERQEELNKLRKINPEITLER